MATLRTLAATLVVLALPAVASARSTYSCFCPTGAT